MISSHKQNTLTQEMLNTSYSIPLGFRKDGNLSRYYILRWSKAFFLLQPQIGENIIWHQGQRYQVTYASRPLYEASFGTEKRESVILSFRCPSIALQKKGLIPTCYVTLLKTL